MQSIRCRGIVFENRGSDAVSLAMTNAPIGAVPEIYAAGISAVSNPSNGQNDSGNSPRTPRLPWTSETRRRHAADGRRLASREKISGKPCRGKLTPWRRHDRVESGPGKSNEIFAHRSAPHRAPRVRVAAAIAHDPIGRWRARRAPPASGACAGYRPPRACGYAGLFQDLRGVVPANTPAIDPGHGAARTGLAGAMSTRTNANRAPSRSFPGCCRGP